MMQVLGGFAESNEPGAAQKPCGAIEVSLKCCESGERQCINFKDRVEFNLPSKAERKLKRRRFFKTKKKKHPPGSATLFQAYLNLISYENKNINVNILTEKIIQPPNTAKSSSVCGFSDRNEPNATPKNCGAVDGYHLSLKCESGDKQCTNFKNRVKLDLPSKTNKKFKKRKKKKQRPGSATLSRSCLDLIPPAYKKTNEDLLKEENIQTPNIEKSSSFPPQPTSPQKILNEKQTTRRLIKEYSNQKNTTSRRDMLAESFEIFLPILESAGFSKEMETCFDSHESSGFNEISNSKNSTLHLNPSFNESLEFNLKRNSEPILPLDLCIPKKENINSCPFSISRRRIDFEVVIMKDSQGSPLAHEYLDEIKDLLNCQVMRFILDNENPHFIPQFLGLKVDKIHKWLIVNCKNEDTMNWVLNWKPLNTSQTFMIVKSDKAPWRSVRICFTIRKDNPQINRVIRLLASQNRKLNVSNWSLVKITGHLGEWILYFLLTVDQYKILDELGWVVFFELGTLQLSRV